MPSQLHTANSDEPAIDASAPAVTPDAAAAIDVATTIVSVSAAVAAVAAAVGGPRDCTATRNVLLSEPQPVLLQSVQQTFRAATKAIRKGKIAKTCENLSSLGNDVSNDGGSRERHLSLKLVSLLIALPV